MTITFTEFKDQAKKILDIDLDGYKLDRVERRTKSLMRRYQVEDLAECIDLIKHDTEFKDAYLNHFTINTSEFFRNPENFKFLQSDIFPKLFEENDKINIWSAPCSNGSEPYTMAIILKEMGISPSKFTIYATDLDHSILATAKEAKYKENSLKNVSDKLLNKYFEESSDGKTYALNSEIKRMVKFEQLDLINARFKKDWDLILSRNFFIYLTKDMKDQLIKKFTSVLNPGGYFFLGNTEYIFSPEKYGLNKIFQSFYQYQNKK